MVWMFLLAALALAAMTYFAARQVREATLLEERLIEDLAPLPAEPRYGSAASPVAGLSS